MKEMEWKEQEINEGVALVTMNHEGENRLSGPFTAELRATLAQLAQEEEVQAVVLTGGHEKYFCTGLDLPWMSQQPKETIRDFLLDISQLLKDTALFGKPLIGAINGHAFGLGCIWSSIFDFRLMRNDRGWACFPEMDINIPFLPGMIAACVHGLGTPLFREMAWTAKRYSGPEAVQLGWARKALPANELLQEARELARFLAQKKQPAFALTKQRWARHLARVIDEEDPLVLNDPSFSWGS